MADSPLARKHERWIDFFVVMLFVAVSIPAFKSIYDEYGIKRLLVVLSSGTGFGSAFLWMRSALVPVPNASTASRLSVEGDAESANLEKLMSALRWQSTLNKWAAAMAALTVFMQNFMQLYWP